MSTEDALRRCAEANQRHQERIAQLERHARDEHAMGQAFVDRINELERENTELRAIAKVVTQGLWYERTQEATNGFVFCLGCGVELWPLGASHRDECVVTKARKLLGTDAKL